MMTHPADAHASRRSRKRISTALAVVTAVTAASLLAGCSSEEPAAKPPKRPDPVVPSPHKSSHAPTPKTSGFSPYVDTSLTPSFDLVKGAEETGVKEYNLAFVSPGGGCVPKWGGRQALGANPVARQVDQLRAQGGDVRVSFGGQSGNELARVCGSVDKLVAAYSKVIDAYGLKKADFDIEGPALTDTKANRLRAQAIARLQQRGKLDVSVTLPVMPSGLNRNSLAVLKDTRKNGARISTVNIMAMDYGTYYDGDMGKYAVAAATATQKQVKGVLGIRDEATAWKSVGVTPMIGVNDVKGEVFRPDDAAELKKFAEEKRLGRLSMWSITRDKPCPGGANLKAVATCSSLGKKTNEFVRAFAD
ncbi:hypothetical protein GCM10010217_44070 [Streptomyces tubercidicus]